MPHFTITLSPNGPLVNAAISVSKVRSDALQLEKRPIPPPVNVRALIDTGASGSCIDPSIRTQLGLTPTGTTKAHSPGTKKDAPHDVDQFDVGIFIPGLTATSRAFYIPTVQVMEFDLDHQGFQVILGRDILTSCVLIYEGQAGLFTLTY